MAAAKMHQTTVRFGADLWVAVEAEASAIGVSVAQYVREAALARLAYNAGRRGDTAYAAALGEAAAEPPEDVPSHSTAVATDESLARVDESLAERAGRLH
jgi:hypothetical protein